MPPRSQKASNNQASLENWFKKPKSSTSSRTDKASAGANTTDDDGEGKTLPPPSEPESDLDEDLDLATSAGKGPLSAARPTNQGEDVSEMEDDDEEPMKWASGKKYIMAQEPAKPARKPRGSATTSKSKASTSKAASSSKPKKAAKTTGTRGKKKSTKGDSDEEEEEEEDFGSEDDSDPLYKSKAHPDDLKLPPLSTMQSIFRDIVTRNPKLRNVAELFDKHKDRNGNRWKLRVGTMCSGTESPLLALQLISEAMEVDPAFGGKKLEIEHIFSCEIEPFKQAYIERNFRPPILFRDVTELGGEEATTAYGALVPVPGNIDMLIAGTSCVDYSTLNVHQKAIDEGGESGNTFFGMLSYVKRHRPPIVILENVCGAPWDHVGKEFDQIGYKAKHVRLDTKGFYIPHTRTRVYLVAVEAQRARQKGISVRDIPDAWIEGMKTYMQRPASVSLDAFLLPSDDPRIHEGRQKLAFETKQSAGRRRKEVEWARCEQRHARARAQEELGNKRPLTKWEEGGGFSFQDHIWEDWCGDAVLRVKDLMDISHLRAAKTGVDASYKTLVWNLSQNVDRQIGSGRLGIAPCLTPTMIAYITNRGGPLVGIEALGLQGLPVDRLLLTSETQDQLADLAGNAMSTTVVGSAMILALVLSVPVLEAALEQRDENPDDSVSGVDIETIVDRPLLTDTLDDRITGIEILETRPLKLDATSELSWRILLERSTEARRWCRCEGRSGISDRQMLECLDCKSTSCVKCGLRPEHHYEPVHFTNKRPQPIRLAEEAKKALPMVLNFANYPDEAQMDVAFKVGAHSSVDGTLWHAWKASVVQAMNMQLSFVDIWRQDIWVAIYESPHARLELHMYPKQPEWRLFALPDPSLNANSPIRGMLSSPVARMRCLDTPLKGTWEYAVPCKINSSLVIDGVGNGEDAFSDSWEKSLGLLGPSFRNKMVWKTLKIDYKQAGDQPEFDRDITGIYEYLPKCGTASSTLHKRVRTLGGAPVDEKELDLYFFLDPTRCREGSWDRFVFSTSTRRYEYGECRPIIAKISPEWRQNDKRSTGAECIADWKWVPVSEIKCQPTSTVKAVFGSPMGVPVITIGKETCAKATALLTCSVDIGDSPSELWPVGQWFEVDKLREREYLRLVSWILQRVRDLSHDAQWIQAALAPDLQADNCKCERCAPTPPSIMWYRKEKGRGNEIRAIEDSRQAGPYERALKARPSPFQIHVRYSAGTQKGEIVIGINPATLIHQAASYLPSHQSTIDAAWRLDTAYVPIPIVTKPEFTIPSNRHDEPASQPKGFKLSLRPEQLRSLRWMQQQEDTSEPFVEEEICEGISEHLGWRLEGRARRSMMVRGGVLADQVGYGKTAIMLGLISTRDAKQVARASDCPPGKILAKGTCVIVPAHLVLQWKSEVEKFINTIGKRKPKVVTLHAGSDINSTTVEEIQEADIVIVASTMPNSEHYTDNLGSFSGVTLPSKAGRYFNARLKQAHEALARQVDLLQKSSGTDAVRNNIKSAHENAESQEQFVQPKRLKGRAYAEANEGMFEKLTNVSSRATGAEKPKPVQTRKSTQPLPSRAETGTAQTFYTPTRIFAGVYPPPPETVIPGYVRGAVSAASLKPGRKRRDATRRKTIVLVDSGESDAESSVLATSNGKGSSKKTDSENYVESSSEESESPEDLEPSSESELVSMTEDESDAPRTKKATPKLLKKSAKEASKGQGQKRKVMESAMEEDGAGEPPKKKAKLVKPKKTRALMDPWKLSSAEVQKDWTQIRAPPLDMFHFHRLVIDEFTYTKKDHISHAIVTQLSATCRWVMSGTPPIGDFASVKGIAAFLNLHLGVDDDAEGSTEEVKSRIQDKTAAEAFHSFREVRSAYWHTARDEIAQRFLDIFVRQNLAEIEDIPLVERICAVTLSASERALYLELEHYLRAQELKMKKTGKSQSDRVRRLNKALGESKTPEEALLKSASHFDCQPKDSLNSSVACDIIVQQREAERDKCVRELRRKLIRSFKTERKLRSSRHRKDNVGKSHFLQTLDEWEHGGDKDKETKGLLAQLVAEAKSPEAVAEPDTASETEEEEKPKGKGGKKSSKSVKKPGRKEEKEEDEMEDAELEWAHRERAHELRALAKELGGRIRSLRFFQCVRAFQGNENLKTNCPQCKRSDLLPNEVSVLSSCGHVGCNACVTAAAANEACVQQASGECRVPASPLFVVPADTLGHDKKADADGRHWGQKLEDITELIRLLPRDERVLIFVQFPDLTKKVAEALTASKLTFTEIKGTALHQAKVLQDFQDPSSKVRILLLNLGDESASGGNLTVANHAIFISPLLSKNQFEYTQAETQAIGRIRRFGQMKTANIYRFVTRSTIDEEIYTNRGQTLGDLSKRVQISRTIALKDDTDGENLSGAYTSGIEMDTSE